MTEKISKLMMINLGLIEANIQGFAEERRNWLDHERKVEETKNLEEGDPAKYAWFPPPQAHPLIMSVVDENGVADYEIEDDTYIQVEQEFTKKKAALFNAVENMEREETEKLIPPGKGRLMGLHEQRINEEDRVKTTNIISDKLNKKEQVIPDDVTALVKASRPRADADFMNQMEKVRNAVTDIVWWAAEQQSAISDLTPETIDAFEIIPYAK